MERAPNTQQWVNMDRAEGAASLLLLLILPHAALSVTYEEVFHQYRHGEQNARYPSFDHGLLRQKLQNIVDSDFPAHEERYKVIFGPK